LALTTLTGQIQQLRSRTVSSLELVDAAITKIEADDHRINSIVVKAFDPARQAAKVADRRLAEGEHSPLLGVPITIKEAFNVAGLPTTWGHPTAREFRPEADSVPVQRLKAAGAIVLGKSNVPLNAIDFQSYNDVYGTTNNPWNIARTPGGSSGGSAAAIAAGYVALELGSDQAGSLRIPAHFCGVLAHRPTFGLVPLRGLCPPGAPALQYNTEFVTAGPIARSAEDLSIALDVLAAPDLPQAEAWRLVLPSPQKRSLADFRILVLEEHPSVPTSREIRSAFSQLIERLEDSGATVLRRSDRLPDLSAHTRIYRKLLAASVAALPADLEFAQRRVAAEMLSEENLMLAAEGLRGLTATHRDWIKTNRQRIELVERWRGLFEEIDVLVCPVSPTTAFGHDHSDIFRRSIRVDETRVPYLDQTSWCGLASLTGFPATTMPLQFSGEGLPIGMQIMAGPFRDRTSLKFARCYEQSFGGFVPPPDLTC
jgi:amidase